MKEEQYTFIGWALLSLSILIAAVWCVKGTGLAGWFVNLSMRLFETRLVQLSCLLNFVVVCIPGYIAKRYFDQLAWKAHLESLPPPNIRESAKRSKYVKADNVAVSPPAPVKAAEIPEGQEEFVATCTGCGHLFAARKDSEVLKCPSCEETFPI